jgi:hypothetical protein
MKNMIRALSMMEWKNTPEDWQRRFEAEIIMKARRKGAPKRKKNPRSTIEYNGLLWNKTDFVKKIHALETMLKSDEPEWGDKYHMARQLQAMKDKLGRQKNPAPTALYTGRYSVPPWRGGYSIMSYQGTFLCWNGSHFFNSNPNMRVFFPRKSDAEHALRFFNKNGRWPKPSGGISTYQEVRYSR